MTPTLLTSGHISAGGLPTADLPADPMALYGAEPGCKWYAGCSQPPSAGQLALVHLLHPRPVQKLDRGSFGGKSTAMKSRLPRTDALLRQERWSDWALSRAQSGRKRPKRMEKGAASES